jgi:CTP:phosphocholine cytidylyltransferase-like protein
MIDMSYNSERPTNASTEDTLQQFRDRIALRTRGLNDTYAETNNISTLQNQDKQLKERYKVTSDNRYTTEQYHHSDTNETTEHKLHDLRRQTSELQAQSKNTELIPKASHYV